MEIGDTMEIAEITLPPYLFDTVRHPNIELKDNRRFTMRDIAALEQRIENLETYTTLSSLELNTQSLEVRDNDGLNRFKTGFVVNDFSNRSFIDFDPETGSRCDVDVARRELISAVDFWSIRPELATNPSIDLESADENILKHSRLLATNLYLSG